MARKLTFLCHLKSGPICIKLFWTILVCFFWTDLRFRLLERFVLALFCCFSSLFQVHARIWQNFAMELNPANYLRAQLAILSNKLDELYGNFFQSNFVCQICAGNHSSYVFQCKYSIYPPRYELDHYVSNYQ